MLSGHENLLDCIESGKTVGLEVGGEVGTEQPMVHEGLVALVGEVGKDDLLEKGGILLMNEEIELVAGEFRVPCLLFGKLEPRPIEDEPELCQVAVFAQ